MKPDVSFTPARAWIAGLVLLVVAWGGHRDARADQARVCVLKVSGADRSFKFELAKMIDQPFSILRASSFYKATRRLKIGRRITPRKLRRLSRYLGLDAIVDGELSRRGRRYQLVLKVRDAATGEISERIRMRLRKKTLSERDRRRLRRQLINAIQRIEIVPHNQDRYVETAKNAETIEAGSDEGSDDDFDDDGFEDGDADIDDDGFEDGDADIDEGDDFDDDGFEDGDADIDEGSGDFDDEGFEDGDADIDEGSGDSGDEDSSVSRRASRGPASGRSNVIVNGGLGALFRNLSFATTPGLEGTENPIDYQGGLVPAAYVSVEAYPAALLGKKGPLVNLGVDASFEQALTISTTIDPDGGVADNAFDVATRFRKISVGARYRVALGPIEVAARAGIGQSNFSLDKGAAMGTVDIPNTKYTYFDPGVSARYQVGKLAVDAGGRYLMMLGAGEIVDSASYGRANITAFDATGGVSYAVMPNVAVRLGFRFTQVALKFAGGGMLSDRNGDNTQDVLGAKDLYAGGLLSGSYRF